MDYLPNARNSTPRINLTQLKKCDQRWEEMTPTEKGRLCQKCQNVIIDFRKSTHQEVAETHAFSSGKVCGIYREDQKQLPKRPEIRSRSIRWKSIYLGVVGFLFSQNMEAQEISDPVKIEQTSETLQPTEVMQDANRKVAATPDSVIISGRLRDENQEPLFGGIVVVKNANIGAFSDIDGFYSLNITKAFGTAENVVLEVKYVGYETQEMVIQKSKGSQVLNVAFEEEGDNIISFEISPRHEEYGDTLWDTVKKLFRGRNER